MSEELKKDLESLTEEDLRKVVGGQGGTGLAKIPCPGPGCGKSYTIMELNYRDGELYCPSCGAFVTWIDIG